MPLSHKHQKTLEAIFARPTPANLKWARVEALLVALGARVQERAGSRVSVVLNGVPAVFHRPHPSPEMDKGAVVDMARFLEKCGVQP